MRGDPAQCFSYADQLLKLGHQGKLRESIARAHRWRGDALLARREFDAAHTELSSALELSEQRATPRLSWDIRRALALIEPTGSDSIDHSERHLETSRSIESDPVGPLAAVGRWPRWPLVPAYAAAVEAASTG